MGVVWVLELHSGDKVYTGLKLQENALCGRQMLNVNYLYYYLQLKYLQNYNYHCLMNIGYWPVSVINCKYQLPGPVTPGLLTIVLL